MRHPEGARFLRRLRRRQAALAQAMAPELPPELRPGGQPPRHPLGDPRAGEDRRQAERRARSMTPAEVDDWLKRNGVPGGDRRRGERRQGDRRAR